MKCLNKVFLAAIFCNQQNNLLVAISMNSTDAGDMRVEGGDQQVSKKKITLEINQIVVFSIFVYLDHLNFRGSPK